MTVAAHTVAVLADEAGNLYIIPERVALRGRVPEEDKAALLRQLENGTAPTPSHPVQLLGWAHITAAPEAAPP